MNLTIDTADISDTDAAAITESVQRYADLLAADWGAIRKIMDRSEDNSVTVSFSIKLQLAGKRIAGTGKLSYSEKFTHDTEFLTPDFDQTLLPIEKI